MGNTKLTGNLPYLKVSLFHFPSFIYRQDGYELSVIIIGAKVVISSYQKNYHFSANKNDYL